jgi:hypothetical protein
VSRRVSLALEILEDRTVPSTVPVLGNLAPALGNLSAITSPLAASPAGTATSPTLASAASTLSGVASGVQSLAADLTKTLQSVITDERVGHARQRGVGSVASTLNGVSSSLTNLASDVTKTLQSVIADVTHAIKLVGDTLTTTLTTVTNTLTTVVGDLKTLLTDVTTTVTNLTATPPAFALAAVEPVPRLPSTFADVYRPSVRTSSTLESGRGMDESLPDWLANLSDEEVIKVFDELIKGKPAPAQPRDQKPAHENSSPSDPDTDLPLLSDREAGLKWLLDNVDALFADAWPNGLGALEGEQDILPAEWTPASVNPAIDIDARLGLATTLVGLSRWERRNPRDDKRRPFSV